MKLAFISDIHGNAIALEAVLEDINRKGIDKIYVLGDLCFRGPEPKRSLNIVRSLNTDVIKGNTDEWVVRGVGENEVAQKAFEMMNIERNWTTSLIEPEDLDYLSHLPTEIRVEVDGIAIQAFHATPKSLFEVVPPHSEDEVLEKKIMLLKTPKIYIYAHIHKPFIRYINGKVVINIGSVGLPFDGSRKASYGIVEIENGNLSTSIERVDFNWERVVEQYNEVKYPNREMMQGVIKQASI